METPNHARQLISAVRETALNPLYGPITKQAIERAEWILTVWNAYHLMATTDHLHV